MGDGEELSEQDWSFVQNAVPIACVDFVPVRHGPNGAISEIGLIERSFPDQSRDVWCHLGGRIRLGESIADALQRHARHALDGAVEFPGVHEAPLGVVEWFRECDPVVHDGTALIGIDPRKHAVSLCYLAEPLGELGRNNASTEAKAFRWFKQGQLEQVELWPGADLVVDRILSGASPSGTRWALPIRGPVRPG